MADRVGAGLARKLGLRDGATLAVVGAPDGFAEAIELPAGVQLRTHARGRVDVVVFFVTRRAELSRRFAALERALVPSGMLWIAWPKRTSGVATNLSEMPVREVGVEHGLTDGRIAVIDDTWWGLGFVCNHRAART